MASQATAQAATAALALDSQQAQQNNAVKLEGLEALSSATQQPSTAAVAPAQSAPAASPTGTQQTCKWSNPICRELFQTPEDLYQHLTEVHVGRKSNNNLNLTCRWEQCNTTVIKRDHITSHLRVHVALKPHTCPKCNKSFKRPQDLKKHIKTHADDSANGQAGGMNASAYPPQPSPAFYSGAMGAGNGINFSVPQQSGGYYTSYTPSSGQMNHSFGANSAYWTPQTSGPQASFSLGGLLGAHRADQFNPHDYHSFRPQIETYEAMHHAPYMGASGGVAVAGGPYQSPHDLAQSIRTKNDLSQVHAMLKEMHQAALSHHNPIPMPAPGNIDDHSRASGSPPGSYRTDSVSSLHSYNRSTTSPTPSLTPGSSVHSYTHSPAHDHVLPSTQPLVSYPPLPGSNGGPIGAGLGSQYDVDPRYRQHYRPLGAPQTSRDNAKAGASGDTNDAALDPALRGTGGSEQSGKEEDERRESSATPTPESPRLAAQRARDAAGRQADMLESWIKAIQERLEAGDYEEEDDEPEPEDSSDHEMPDAPTRAEAKAEASNPSYPDLPLPDY